MAKYFIWLPYMCVFGVKSDRLLVCLLAVLAINSGRNSFDFDLIWQALLNPYDEGFVSKIIWDVRLPRLVTAIFAGAALGISGAIFQSISRNPLGSPDIIGFTTGAASGAIFYLIFLGESNLGVAVSAEYWGALPQQ